MKVLCFPVYRGAATASMGVAGAEFTLAGVSCLLCFLSSGVIRIIPDFTLSLYTLSVFLPDISTAPSLLICISLFINKCVHPFTSITAICISSVKFTFFFLECLSFLLARS